MRYICDICLYEFICHDGRVGTRQSDRQRGRRRDGRFSLPSAPRALGKAFAECPIKDTRQRGLCRSIFYLVFFTECRTRQKLCRVKFGLCRVPQALDKEPESSSACLGCRRHHSSSSSTVIARMSHAKRHATALPAPDADAAITLKEVILPLPFYFTFQNAPSMLRI